MQDEEKIGISLEKQDAYEQLRQTGKDELLKIEKPFLHRLCPSTLITEGTSKHNILWCIWTSLRDRYDVVYMILVQRRFTPVAFTLLNLMLLLYVSGSKLSTILFQLVIAFPKTCILCCPICSKIRSAFHSKGFSVCLPIQKFLFLDFIGVLQIVFFTSSFMACFALDIQSIGLSFIQMKVLRCGWIGIMTTSAFLQNILAKRGRGFLMSLVCSFGILLIHALPAHIMKTISAICFGFEMFTVHRLRITALDAKFLPWRWCLLRWLWMLKSITRAHIFATTLFTLRKQTISVYLRGMKKLDGSRKELFAIFALLLRSILRYSVHTISLLTCRHAWGRYERRSGTTLLPLHFTTNQSQKLTALSIYK